MDILEITGELKQILERFELKVAYDLELIVKILRRAGKNITPTNLEIVPKVSVLIEYLFILLQRSTSSTFPSHDQ